MKQHFSFLVLMLVFSAASAQFVQEPLPSGYTNAQVRYKNDLHIDNLGNYWVAFRNIGLGKYDGNTWLVYDSLNNGLLSNNVRSITETATGNIAICYSNGISIYNGSSWIHYDHINSSLPDTGITAIKAEANNLWIGTHQGLFYFDGTSFTNYTSGNSGLVNDHILSINTNSGALLIGTINGLSIFQQSLWTTVYIDPSSSSVNKIIDAEISPGGEIWLLNNAGKIYFSNSALTSITAFDSIVPQNIYDCSNHYFTGYEIELFNGEIVLSAKSYYSNFLIRVGNNFQLHYALAPPTLTNTYFDINNNQYGFLGNYVLPNSTLFFIGTFSDFNFNQLTSYYINSYDLDINQVKAKININGTYHGDLLQVESHYNIPKCENTITVFTSSPWVGGYDTNNNLHLAGGMYKSNNSTDYWPGPIDTVNCTSDSAISANYIKAWKINKSTIEEFILNYQNGNVANGSYIISDVISNWPANGTGNVSRQLAPFKDNNNDGIYNPIDGDFPCIYGDQEIWSVYNDVRLPHTETAGTAMGIEIHSSSYSFDVPDNSDTAVIDFTTFYQLKIFNRSDTAYHDVYFGMFADTDLGNASDDYVQCNPDLDYGFAINGDSIDEGIGGYGLNPPVQNVAVLQGTPAILNDAIDNDHDGTTDESDETNMMSSFRWVSKYTGTPMDLPFFPEEYYNYLTNKWPDSTSLTFGNDGYDISSTQYSNYAFPGTEDFNFPAQNWTMATAGMPPNDNRLLVVSGPFTLLPGEMKSIDLAYIYTRDSSGGAFPDAAIAHNKAEVIKVKEFWQDHNQTTCNLVFGLQEQSRMEIEVRLHPNPSSDVITINTSETDFNGAVLEIYDAIGQLCRSEILTTRKFDVSTLVSQLYIVKIINKDITYFGKFIRN